MGHSPSVLHNFIRRKLAKTYHTDGVQFCVHTFVYHHLYFQTFKIPRLLQRSGCEDAGCEDAGYEDAGCEDAGCEDAFTNMNHTVREPRNTKTSLRINMKKFAFLVIPIAPSEDSDQPARMRRLIWIFAGRACLKVRYLTLLLIWLS